LSFTSKKKVKFIPTPIFSELKISQYKSQKNKRKWILFVGRLDDNKNPEFAIEGFINSSYFEHGFHLHLFGEGILKLDLIRKYSTFIEKIHFHGNCPNNEVLNYMGSSDALIITSVSEGFPKVAIEANEMGCKVVSPVYNSLQPYRNYLFPIEEYSVQGVSTALEKAFKAPKFSKIPFFEEYEVLKLYEKDYHELS